MSQKVTYFTAGAIATSEELADIAALNAQAAAPFTVHCENSQAVVADANQKSTDYVAGTLVEPYDDSETYTVYDPDDPPEPTVIATKAIVADGDEFANTGSPAGTITVTVVDNVATMAFVAD